MQRLNYGIVVSAIIITSQPQLQQQHQQHHHHHHHRHDEVLGIRFINSAIVTGVVWHTYIQTYGQWDVGCGGLYTGHCAAALASLLLPNIALLHVCAFSYRSMNANCKYMKCIQICIYTYMNIILCIQRNTHGYVPSSQFNCKRDQERAALNVHMGKFNDSNSRKNISTRAIKRQIRYVMVMVVLVKCATGYNHQGFVRTGYTIRNPIKM